VQIFKKLVIRNDINPIFNASLRMHSQQIPFIIYNNVNLQLHNEKMHITIHSLYSQIFKIWRKLRFKKFLEILQPGSQENLLDVGGTPQFWFQHPRFVREIVVINNHKFSWEPELCPTYHLQFVIADGCQLPLRDFKFEIGFSNSVIEHVGSWEKQKKFAAEISRASQKMWLQTPAYECPVEPHYLALFFHYFPPRIQKRLLRWLSPWGWIAKPSQIEIDRMVDTTRLIRKNEMFELFPDCEIYTEKFLFFFPKSYIAVRKPLELIGLEKCVCWTRVTHFTLNLKSK